MATSMTWPMPTSEEMCRVTGRSAVFGNNTPLNRPPSKLKGFQRRLGLNVKEHFVSGIYEFLKCLSKSIVNDIYACFVLNSDIPQRCRQME